MIHADALRFLVSATERYVKCENQDEEKELSEKLKRAFHAWENHGRPVIPYGGNHVPFELELEVNE